jgi:hypothetical protein
MHYNHVQVALFFLRVSLSPRYIGSHVRQRPEDAGPAADTLPLISQMPFSGRLAARRL